MTTLLNFIVNEDLAHNDRALNYGDGCFTTIRCYKGQAELLGLHAARLYNDAKRLSIFCETEGLTANDFRLLVSHGAQYNFSKTDHDYYVTKILISRGNGNRGYAPDEPSVPTIIISHHHLADTKLSPMHIGISDVSLSQQRLLAGIKHLNRLEQVLAKLHLKKQRGWDDALMLDEQKRVIELTAANVFFKVGDVWYTPELTKCGVSGVMRTCILAYLDEQNIAYKVGDYHLSFLATASAAFCCNALSHLRIIQSLEYLESIIEFDTAESEKLSIQIDQFISLDLEEQCKENT